MSLPEARESCYFSEMLYGETERRVVERHDCEGQVTLDRQRALIDNFGGLNLPLEKARGLLADDGGHLEHER